MVNTNEPSKKTFNWLYLQFYFSQDMSSINFKYMLVIIDKYKALNVMAAKWSANEEITVKLWFDASDNSWSNLSRNKVLLQIIISLYHEHKTVTYEYE